MLLLIWLLMCRSQVLRKWKLYYQYKKKSIDRDNVQLSYVYFAN